jgi:hypothetical protein
LEIWIIFLFEIVRDRDSQWWRWCLLRTPGGKKVRNQSLPWWCMPVIAELRRLKQENGVFEATLDYIARYRLRKTNQQTYSGTMWATTQ